MENASKALIIAGAILLAIVIISLGLIVVNNSRSAVDSANMNEQEIQTFNAKFTPYEGKDINGTRVKTLLQAIIASNNTNQNQVAVTTVQGTVYKKIVVKTATSDESDIALISASITSNPNYNITLGYNNSVVNLVTINEK